MFFKVVLFLNSFWDLAWHCQQCLGQQLLINLAVSLFSGLAIQQEGYKMNTWVP